MYEVSQVFFRVSHPPLDCLTPPKPKQSGTTNYIISKVFVYKGVREKVHTDLLCGTKSL